MALTGVHGFSIWTARPCSIASLNIALKFPRLGDRNTHFATYHGANPCPCAVGLFQIPQPPEPLSFVKILHGTQIHAALLLDPNEDVISPSL